MWLFEVFFWISTAGVAHSYLIYPWLLRLHPSIPPSSPTDCTDWPAVHLIFAAFNEQAVIEKKLQSIIQIDYPRDKFRITIGSDASTDQTDDIISHYAQKYPFITLQKFTQRTGKARIINKIVEESSAEILVLTDANIIHTPEFLKIAVAALLHNSTLGAVGGTLHYFTSKSSGIAPQENFYRQRENAMKFTESSLWGYPMGLEGGLYVIRRSLFAPIPKNYFMEDFFQTLHLYCRGYKAILHPGVIAYEDVSTLPSEEFQRKKRISIGNFQNLFHFFTCIHSRPAMAFVFWSHKGLRWITPFLLLLALLSAAILAMASAPLYAFFTLCAAAAALLALIGYLSIRLDWKLNIPQYLYHFIHMNFALLIGFIEYTKGVKSNVWQPTRRNQV
ncbi:glycosyltransferase [Schleiferia thermophila]